MKVVVMAKDHQEHEIFNLAVVQMPKNHANCILKEIFVMMSSSSSLFYKLQKINILVSEQIGGIF